VRYKTNLVPPPEIEYLESDRPDPATSSTVTQWTTSLPSVPTDRNSWLGRHIAKRHRQSSAGGRVEEAEAHEMDVDGDGGNEERNAMNMNVLASWEKDVIME
jgi:hypothetical protein